MALRMVKCDGKDVSFVVRALMMVAIIAQRTAIAISSRTTIGNDESRKFDTGDSWCFFDGRAASTRLMSHSRSLSNNTALMTAALVCAVDRRGATFRARFICL